MFGLTKIEISSDKLVEKLMKKGLGAKKAISIGVFREGVSTIVTEAYLQGGKVNPADFFLAVAFGIPYSLFASKQFGRKVNIGGKKAQTVADRISKSTVKKLSSNKVNKYASKVIAQTSKQNGKKLSSAKLSNILKDFSEKERKDLARTYVKNAVLITRKDRRRIMKYVGVNKIGKLVDVVKDPIINFFDPFEFLGDKVQDLSTALTRKIKLKSGKSLRNKKLKASLKSKKKTISKAKPKSVSRSKTKTKPKTKTRIKSRSKSKSKVKPRVKPKVKPKPRPKPKVKPRVKPKAKPKPKPKPKPKVKPKPKPKPRVKTKNVPLLIPRKRGVARKVKRKAYNIAYKTSAKSRIKVLKSYLPMNKAKRRINSLIRNKKIIAGKLKWVGYTVQKDIKPVRLLRRK